MAFKSKHQHELVAILVAGGGLELSARGHHQHELVALAGAAKRGECQLILADTGALHQHEFIEIATAGKGNVTFKD